MSEVTLSPRGRFSGGRFHPPAAVVGQLDSRSPEDPADSLGVFPYGEEDVAECVVAAVRSARNWGAIPVPGRCAALARIGDELAARQLDLARCLQRETGRPPWECQREIQGLLSRLEQTLLEADGLLEDRTTPNLPGRVVSRPLGVVAVLGPAMLPLSTSHTHILAALAAGNSVVWKPSPLCPASAQIYAEALAGADLPPGVFNMLLGGDDVGQRLCAHEQIDGVVFTGTTAHGLELRRALIDRLDRHLVLHLSAKNPAVVLEDADVTLAAYEVAVGAFLSAGQRCTAISRVLVHGAVLDEFLGALLPLCTKLQVGPPATNPFMGPLLTEARYARFQGLLDQAVPTGAEVLLPSTRLPLPGCFVSPSVHLVRQRQPGSPYQREELFGPDLAIYPVRDIDDALPLCDEGPYGLCAALFSRSRFRWQRFCEEVRAGALFWNRGTSAPSGRLPFGGVKYSGLGGRGGADAPLALRREVSVLGRTSEDIEVLPGTPPTPRQRTRN